MSNTKEKKYTEYKKERPTQLDLFSFNNIFESKRDKYSGTVELYDILPKYFHDDVEPLRIKGKYLDIVKRDFVYKKQGMVLKLTPASLEQKDGSTKAFFPTQREEIIEDVLRKFATDSNRNEFLDDRLSVRFTLYDLWKELKKIKHEYNYSQIREALEILNKTNLEIKTENEEITFSSNMFESFGIVNKNKEEIDFDDDSDNEKKRENASKNIVYFVRFNSLVSNSIKDKSWRIINYDQCMQYKRAVSRWLHKRISHLFLARKIELPYNILLSTIIRDSGMTKYARITDNMIQVQKCLAEMISIGSIDRYVMEKIYSEEKKNKLEDVKFLIYVSHTFFDDMKLNSIALNEDTKPIDIDTEGKIVDREVYYDSKSNTSGVYLIKDCNISENENGDENDNNKLKLNQQDLLDSKELKTLLKDFNLSGSDLDKILSYKNDKSFPDIKKNIKCAISYINRERDNNRNCNTMAVIISAIKNDWNGQDLLDNKTFGNDVEINDKQEILKNLLSNITNEEYKLISQLFIKYFGENIYISWLSKLNFVSIKETSLNLSCDNQFIIDRIKDNFLNGIQAKNKDGIKYWHRKGIKQIVEEVLPNIKRINIKYENNS